ncbi:MAG: phosphoglycerate kinase, partial [bacterium]
MRKKTIGDVKLEGRRAIVRVDFNVPLDEEKRITDDLRIRAALPTIEYLLSKNAAVILMSHLGRPKGKRDDAFSLRPVCDYLKEKLECRVSMAPDCVGEETRRMAGELKPGEVLLLENLRFHKGETDNDPAFAKELASLAEVYVNDAFGTAHRAHASTEGITHHIGTCVAGLLLKKEIEYFENTLESAERPFIAILGGAKVSDKIMVIRRLLEKVDAVLIGGGMAFTFFKAEGKEVGASKLEEDRVGEAKEIMETAGRKGSELLLPVDILAASEFSADAEKKQVGADGIPAGWMGLDIGDGTIRKYCDRIRESRTVLWNGPMGVFEMEPYAKGTFEVAKAIAETDCVSIVGGGDSAAAIRQMGLADRFTHISTGGGASL